MLSARSSSNGATPDQPTNQATIQIEGPELFRLQREIADHPARFKVVLGGRRFGKTRVGASIALKTTIKKTLITTLNSGGLVWWVAPVYSQSEIAYELLKPLFQEIPGARCLDGKLAFFLPGGGALWFKSADRPDRLRGRGLDGLVIDEADFIDGTLWSKTLRAALSDRKGWALFLSSPNRRNGWFHKLFKLGQSGTNPAWMSWHCPSIANPYLDPQEIEDAQKDMTKEEHDQEYGALYVDSHELVYYNFDEDIHVRRCPINKTLPIGIGLDFNNRPRVAVFLQQDGDVFRVVGELHHNTPATTDEHAQMVAAWLKGQGFAADPNTKKWGPLFKCYPDASGKALRNGGGTNIDDFVQAGFTLEYPNANPHIIDRDNIMLARFMNKLGQVRLIIDPSCTYLIQCLKELKNKNRDGSPWGHILDALGYAIYWLVTTQATQQAADQFLSAAQPSAANPKTKRGQWSTY